IQSMTSTQGTQYVSGFTQLIDRRPDASRSCSAGDAIERAHLVPERAGSQPVKDLAATIKAAQAPEIEKMTSWLQVWGASTANSMPMGTSPSMGASESPSSGMDMSLMPGSMTTEQMAETELADGSNTDALELVDKVKSSQTEETMQ
ncbi:MAG: DUF305 domain-containing protein, partial [Nakamurella sp.]